MIGEFEKYRFPMFPGYALGSIIDEGTLLLPWHEREQINLTNIVEQLKAERTTLESSDSFKIANVDEKQAMVNNLATRLIDAKKRCDENQSKIKELKKTKDTFDGQVVEKSLSLDETRTKVHSEYWGFQDERFECIEFTAVEGIADAIQGFVTGLFHRHPITILPPGTIEEMATKIDRLIREKKINVTLVGAIISLGRVRSIEPLLLDPKAAPPNDLLKAFKSNPDKYYVLSGAILGGVLFGWGTFVKSDQQQIKTALSSVSLISLGAISTTNQALDNVNFWEVFQNWKKTLLENTNSGYPLQFKVRKLTDVFLENKIKIE